MDSRNISSAATAVLAATLLTGAGPRGAAASGPAGAGVCRDIRNCQVVAFKDVDGDGARDHVGYVVPSSTWVTLRVKTARGSLLTRRLRTPSWPGGAWLGAARIDGRRGVELVIGTDRGAHAELFSVVTYRRGELVAESAPGQGGPWVIDASVGSFAGVWRRVENGHTVVTLKSAQRTRGWMYMGKDHSYVWRQGAWQHRNTVRTSYRGYANAAKINGWHVRGLPTWPTGRP